MTPLKFIVSIDSVIFGFKDGCIHIPLYRRGSSQADPFPNCWSLPGGPIQADETLEQACQRKLEEDLNLKIDYLEQLYTFAEPNRDPRSRAISIAYYALSNLTDENLESGNDALHAKWFPISNLPKSKWAFDHKKIVDTAIKRLKAKISYEPIGFNLLAKEFSIPQLQSLYEAILQRPLDRRNFAKKILSMDLLEQTFTRNAGRGRPTQFYKFNTKQYQKLQKSGFVFDI